MINQIAIINKYYDNTKYQQFSNDFLMIL